MAEIEVFWPRICGVHVQMNGQIAAVWLAHDDKADVIHLYDCHVHDREVLAVQAETMKARGAWIPVAWHEDASEIIGLLRKHGCKTLAEGVKNSDAMAETVSLDIWERMRTGRFKVARHLKPWLEEFEGFQREDRRVPRDTHPLMAATRHAVACLKRAKSKSRARAGQLFPELATV